MRYPLSIAFTLNSAKYYPLDSAVRGVHELATVTYYFYYYFYPSIVLHLTFSPLSPKSTPNWFPKLADAWLAYWFYGHIIIGPQVSVVAWDPELYTSSFWFCQSEKWQNLAFRALVRVSYGSEQLLHLYLRLPLYHLFLHLSKYKSTSTKMFESIEWPWIGSRRGSIYQASQTSRC